MTEQSKETIRRALWCYRGDDLERAKAAFRGMTPGMMEQEHGQSGNTRQSIMDIYVKHVHAIEVALEELNQA